MLSLVTGNTVGNENITLIKHVQNMHSQLQKFPIIPSPKENGPGLKLTSG
jgi:hypothetical protein